jgi:hypothetical protein
MEIAKNILYNILTAFPIYLVMLVGLIVSVVKWKQHPKAALLALCGLLLYILSLVASNVVFPLLSSYINSQHVSYDKIDMLYRGLAVVINLVEAGALCVLLAAVFAGRHNPTLEKTA